MLPKKPRPFLACLSPSCIYINVMVMVVVVVISFNKTLGLFDTLEDSTAFIFFKIQDKQTL